MASTFNASGAKSYIAPAPSPMPQGQPVISISLGVGENPEKRVADPFEEKLLARLSRTGAVLNIDTGSGGEEAERVARAVAASGASRARCFSGSFADFAAQIARSQLYVGYDSAGQHAAAAAGVPLVTVFSGQVCERMFHRWRPVGEGPAEIVRVQGQPPQVILQVAAAAAEKLMRAGRPRIRAEVSGRLFAAPLASLERIAVVRALPGWGDMLCAVPALRALRAAAPRARITLIGLPWTKAFAARFGCYIDELLEFPGYPGLPLPKDPNPDRILSFLEAAQWERRFDLAVQMHGNGITTNPFTAMLGARLTAGFYLPGHYCPDPDRFLYYPEDEPEVRRNLRLVRLLGAPSRGEELEFPLLEEDWAELRASGAGLRSGEYVCLHPGSRHPTRRWPPERFAAIADSLAREGFQVVLTGSAEERPVMQEVLKRMTGRAIPLGESFSFGGLAALFSGARLLVSNDTGVSHLAAALHTPSGVVFTAADPLRWAPLDVERHRALYVPVDCRPCDYEICPIGHPCSKGVSVDRVLAEAGNLLRKELAVAS
jgi:ADP-heptose:LPS heptosyltransferase